MQLILLSAGRGSRLPKKYRDSPKSCVKINNKRLIDYNIDLYKKFKKKIIVTGYKKNKLKKFINENKFEEIYNKQYEKTNMVYSMFLAKNIINDDVVVCYSDIIFNKNIYEDLKKKKSDCIPLNVNWLRLWKKRMSFKSILNDAENVVVKKGIITQIGTKLKTKLPEMQYMGIIKIKKKSFKIIYKFFKKLKDPKIDMTNFINLCINQSLIKFSYIKYKDMWIEVDNINDIKVAEKNTTNST